MNTSLDSEIQARILSCTTDLVALIKRATLEAIVDALGVAEVRRTRELVPEPPPYELTPARPPVSPAKPDRSRAPASATVGSGAASLARDPRMAIEREPVSLEAYEKAALVRALAQCGGDKLATANLLGVGKSTLYRMLTKHAVR